MTDREDIDVFVDPHERARRLASIWRTVAAVLAFVLPSPVFAEVPARIPAEHFAALPLVRGAMLSPDGRSVATRAIVAGDHRILVFDADAPESDPAVFSIGEKAELSGLTWAGSQRLLVRVVIRGAIYGVEVPYQRLFVVDLATRSSRVLDRRGRGIFAGDVLYVDPTGTWALVASQDNIHTYPSVKRVDLATTDATVVEKAKTGVWDWYADQQGVVRAGVAYEGRRWTLWYRESAGEKLRPKRGEFVRNEDGSIDRFFFGTADAGWVVTDEGTGRFGLYEFDFDTSTRGDAIFEHPAVDIDDVLYDPPTRQVRGVNFHDDRDRTHWLDPELSALQQRIDRALPDRVNRMVDWSSDRQRILVRSGGASNPGIYFLLDRASSKMAPVVESYPRIDPLQLAPVRPVTYTARDGLAIPAYLTLPRGRTPEGLPLVLMPHGGPFDRDRWVYDPLVQFIANRGYAVLQPQFRGSTGYGRDFVSRGYGEWGRKMQDDLDDGVDWLVSTGQVDPARVCIVGASYGGYAALWGAIRDPGRYRCAASWAGVSDLAALLRYDRKLFSATRYYREWRTRVAGEEKFDLASVSPITFADKLEVPVLIAHGETDARVPVQQSRAMVQALTRRNADVVHVFYKGSGHDFGSAADLEDFLLRLEEFLARHNPG